MADDDSPVGKFISLWQPSFSMSTLAVDLQATLEEMDADTALKLERLVRSAMELARLMKKPEVSMIDANGWPVGHFEKYAGSLAGEDGRPPADLPA